MAVPRGVIGGLVVAADVALVAGDNRGNGATLSMPVLLVPGCGDLGV